MIATLSAVDKPKIPYELMGNCYKVAAYQASVGTLEVAEDHVLKRDLNIPPAVYIRQAERPKKRRIRSQGESAGKARKPYKFKRCVVHRDTTRIHALLLMLDYRDGSS